MLRVLMGGALVVFAACAHSGGATQCDPSTETCACDPSHPDCASGSSCDPTQHVCVENPDAPMVVVPDAFLGPDAKPKAGFGDPCLDRQDCQSDICILTATGGVCSQLCGTCPDGWGCFGVTGAVDPNEVTNVCVPVTTQLCSVCQHDTECAQIGMDRCLTEATGRAYCARDCSKVSCPTGFDCQSVEISGATYKECVPHSGACDCNVAAQNGATDPCAITTALGTTCAGTRTCGGVAGWGACAPPSPTDDPDGSYADDNCDGIDGDLSKGIFVAGGGSDGATCGLTYAKPCQTISYGVVRAVQAGRQNVYVQAGTYNEVVVLLSGVNIWGGYDFNWQRASYATAGHTVTIVGKQDTSTGGDGEWLTVRAHNLIVPVTMADLVIQGPNAQGTAGASGLDGRSSYAVHVNAASLNLVRVQIKGGAGAGGATGSGGVDAVLVDAQGYMQGAQGGDGVQKGDVCNDSTRGGGGGGADNTCSQSPSSRSMRGGRGGDGGTEDSSCTWPGVCAGSACNATSGGGGSNASYVQGSAGTPGYGGSGLDQCGGAGGGNPGMIANGAAGQTNAGGYVVGNGYWYARNGGGGGTGENGGGGGGGGGAGGCDNGNDSWGGGGGGGGAGGCAARNAGGGGGGGGGSFGVFVTGNSSLTASACDVAVGVAGAGGAGGVGGRGQSGGAPGFPGGKAANGSSPGYGGAGGHGGHGGGGGGGQGGRAIGVGWTPGSTVNQSCTFSGGAAGGGGAGGASAPFAPLGERDGNGGWTGPAGSLDQTRQCAGTGDC